MGICRLPGYCARTVATIVGAAILLGACSGSQPVAAGPVSTPNAGKAAFNDSKAIEKIYHAGYTNISLTKHDTGGVWRGQAIRRSSGKPAVVSVTKDGPVVVY